MPARINNPAIVVPGAMDALQALGAALGNGGVPETTINLVLMRASQRLWCLPRRPYPARPQRRRDRRPTHDDRGVARDAVFHRRRTGRARIDRGGDASQRPKRPGDRRCV